MSSSVRIGTTVAILVTGLLAGACATKPAVTVEQVYEGQELPEDRRSLPRLHPPRCGPLPQAEYPDLPVEECPEIVSVRVDLIIDREGRATRMRATVLDHAVAPEAFVQSALSAAGRFDCLPALQMPSPGSDRIVPTAVEYASSIIFRFHRDERSAKASY